MNTVEVLKAAKALIDMPEKWTQGHPARDAWGWKVRIDSRDATQFCMNGARLRALNAVAYPARCGVDDQVRQHRRLDDATQRLLREACGEYVPSWNDAPERTHTEVMEAFDRAIELAEAEALGESK